MKKLLISLCVVVLSIGVHAQSKIIEVPTAVAGVMLLGGGPAATTTTTIVITRDFWWNGEHASGDTYAKITNDTSDLNGTESNSGSTVNTEQNHTASGASAVDIIDSVENLSFDNTGNVAIHPDQGYISMWVYPTGVGAIQVLSAYRGGSYNFEIFVNSNYTVRFVRADTDSSYNDTSATVTQNTWNQIEVSWNIDDEHMDVRINGGTWDTTKEGNNTLETWTGLSSPYIPTLRIGSYGSYANETYVDDVEIWLTDDQT